MAKTPLRKRAPRDRYDLALVASRGFLLALDTHAYEKAYDQIRDDPEVQKAVDVLLDKLSAAFRKRRAGKSGRPRIGYR